MAPETMGRISLEPYVIDTLMPDLVGHDRRPGAFLVFLFLSRRTAGRKAVYRPLSLRQIAEGTGLSRRAVQNAVARLLKRRLIRVKRESPTAVSQYAVLRPWRRNATG